MTSPPPSDLAGLIRWIESDRSLSACLRHARAAYVDDASHDVGHALRVAAWTLRIGRDTVDPREATVAGLFHDLVDVPKDSPKRVIASELSSHAAKPVLLEAGFEEASIDRICRAIRDHSFSRGAVPGCPLGRALQDADRLEALGAIGILRTAAVAQRMGARFFDDEDPFASRRPLDDRSFSVDHFYVKLLRLPDRMLTAAGRIEAVRRVTLLHQFLAELGVELGVATPEDR